MPCVAQFTQHRKRIAHVAAKLLEERSVLVKPLAQDVGAYAVDEAKVVVEKGVHPGVLGFERLNAGLR